MSFRAVGLACEAFCAGARLTRIFAIFIFHLLVLSFFYSFLSSFLPSFLPSILCFFFLSFFLSVPLSSVIDSLILPFFHLLSRFFSPDVSSSPSLIVRSSNENHYMLHFVMHTWWIQNSIKKNQGYSWKSPICRLEVLPRDETACNHGLTEFYFNGLQILMKLLRLSTPSHLRWNGDTEDLVLVSGYLLFVFPRRNI